jgi:glutaminyl-peptide cyclotransferase
MKSYLALTVIIFLTACNGGTDKPVIDDSIVPKKAPQISYNIVNVYPHDTSAYTEGLQIYNGKLYEGTGMENESTLRITDLKTGKVEKKHFYTDPLIFGEGIQVFKGKIYQLTWKNHIVFVYDEKNIDKPVATLKWPYDGWGMTNNGSDLIISDGTANLYFVDAETFKVKSTVAVTEDSNPIENLNELEYIDGFVWANVWQTDQILKIDPASGHVVGRIDLPDLRQQYFPKEIIPERTDVLNGIAYDSTTKKLFITGKRWPKLFEIKLN